MAGMQGGASTAGIHLHSPLLQAMSRWQGPSGSCYGEPCPLALLRAGGNNGGEGCAGQARAGFPHLTFSPYSLAASQTNFLLTPPAPITSTCLPSMRWHCARRNIVSTRGWDDPLGTPTAWPMDSKRAQVSRHSWEFISRATSCSTSSDEVSRKSTPAREMVASRQQSRVYVKWWHMAQRWDPSPAPDERHCWGTGGLDPLSKLIHSDSLWNSQGIGR